MFEQIEPIELISLISCIAVLGFVIWNRSMLARIPNSISLILSFLFFLIACFMTVIETFLFSDIANLIEHLSYLACSISFLAWYYRTSKW